MAETLISPGVLARENDQSQITSQPVQAGAAIVGPTVKGQVNIPKLVTDSNDNLLYISRNLIPSKKDKSVIKDFRFKKQVCIYAYNKKD